MTQFLGEIDVVVLGAGPGGLASAVSAAKHGFAVAIIESLPTLGGNLPYSSGYVALADTEFQRQLGISDSAELFLADLRREAERARERFGGILVDDVAERYARASKEVYDWLSDIGVTFRALIERPAKHHVPRLHALADPQTATGRLKAQLDACSVLQLANLRAVRVERSEMTSYRVTMRDQRTGEVVEAQATRALVVATGGYQAAFELRSEIQPGWLANAPYLGVPTTLGDGHRLVAGQGARLLNMSFLPAFGHIATTLTEEAVAVNLRGERFHDETDPHDTPVHIESQPSRRAYYVFDSATMNAKRRYITELGRTVLSAPSLAELARRLELPANALERTIDEFNEAVERGDTSALPQPRSNLPRRPIAQPPFHAIEVVIGVSVTYGGAETTAGGAVKDVYGEPIAGLYAVGNANGSLAPCVEVGGVNLGAAMTVGWGVGPAISATATDG